MDRDASLRLAQSLAGLDQAIAILRLFQEVGFNIAQIRSCSDNSLTYQTSFSYIEEEVLRLIALRK